MKYPSCFSFLLLTVLTLSACTGNQVANNKPADQTPSSASPATPSLPSPAAPVPQSSAPASPTSPSTVSPTTLVGGKTYRQSKNLFEISFPQGYTYKETGSGIAFSAADEGFGGSVDYGSAQGNHLTTKQLEDALKQEYESRLAQVSWQDSQLQPDGSIRVDWVGRDKEGNDLDAVSFVEQRGDTIFILNLFGINKPYNSYNAPAQAIVSSYHVRQQ
jgi:hypothetical protein